jgi:apolipoprotein N-acyltransferase
MVAALGGGVMLALAFEPVAAAWIIPFAVAGYVLCCRGCRLRWAWLPGLAFGIGFQFVLLWWMRAVGTDAWLALAGAEAAFLGVLGVATALLTRHRWWPLWVATAWVAVEVWRSGWPFSGMPWGRLAFAVAGTPLVPALPWIGMVGVSLVLALSGTLLAWLVVAAGRARLAAGAALAALAILVAVPLLHPWHGTPDSHLTVAVVQGDVPGPGDDVLYDYRQVTQNQIDATVRLARDVATGAAPRPAFVVWPENSTAVDPFHDQITNAGIRAASAAIGVPILVGAIADGGPTHVLNQGIVWDPLTGAGDRYTKHHPVPFGEYIPWRSVFTRQFGRLAIIPRDMVSGTRQTPLTIAGAQVADAICFDVAYDDVLDSQVRHGAQLLAVQTSNATFVDTDQLEQQFAITRLRAAETGRWLAVASTNGISGIVAPDGSVVASTPRRTQDVLVDRVGLDGSITPGVALGPWTGRACIALTALGLLLAAGVGGLPYARPRRRTAPATTVGDPEGAGAEAVTTA